ncbi:50S ribosomal protein L19 [Candidatus Giovannonibacteria bacterium RIFCSPHIGHO2_02_43_13]|uniref:Large ribosomal subunit protein bL19 n=1 Tax=Candidatus Giovannonibacteria bacterium RIFCSPHIGHO2_02_43_13 TaxID=1798330 RepID=A0A1F5WS49_9BACT|nr:MAG: 50S ribosomal protein L19 [Candidatus Giovannonibacteria bacterium RIFCSPHIGHO2_12_FULL_44_42]OGF78493.1 MAG: 50S ribosomal protein L19 [Candidatus Giovannonibacteria bacterium RIFCSPHIGHO2_02_43_13]OGF89842.1 MAG: 50S ribosomal protein L19 [Candidatus Giovannonibacteria bacterium RIFCSPLOWO2_02_FULL_43_54]OGF96683.1 MAG: 50S ribosomal protein L19 [Candidatus Giovannonibacteria bacterium RIFCSPLOWO2_12_FULL_44_32]
MPTLNIINSPTNIDLRKKLDFHAGDTVRVMQKVKEGDLSRKGKEGKAEADKTRFQAFEGLVLSRKHGLEPGATFTVRKVVSGVGVERIFPLFSPEIEKIEIKSRGRSRRAKLYYVRDIAAREIRKKMKSVRVSFAEARRAEVAEKEAKEASAKEKKEEVVAE